MYVTWDTIETRIAYNEHSDWKLFFYFLGIEDLREKREELNRSILRDEEEKAKIQKVCTSANVCIEEICCFFISKLFFHF